MPLINNRYGKGRVRVMREPGIAGELLLDALDQTEVDAALITLDGRVTRPGSRWVSGEESRRRVHELRAASDAVRGREFAGGRTLRRYAQEERPSAREAGSGLGLAIVDLDRHLAGIPHLERPPAVAVALGREQRALFW